jgi:N-acetylglucosamine kinase-like BadF-type ATPase
LAEGLLNKLGLERPEQLVPLINGGRLDRPGIAALAPVVFDAAGRDKTAQVIVNQSAQELVQAIVTVAGNFGWSAFPLAIAGGLLLSSDSYRQLMLAALVQVGLKPDPVTLVPEPAEGAIRLARAKIQG